MLPILLGACEPDPGGTNLAGRLQNAAIDEASGLARSQRFPNVYWALNDDGPAVLYAIDGSGRDLGLIRIRDANNRDWEDLASFNLDGTPYLIVADIGDNESHRNDVVLYVIEEPEAGDREVEIAWHIQFSYPDGARDAESVAVDVDNREALILTKRDIPARLYSLPLAPSDGRVATLLGQLDKLPQPSRSELDAAPRTDNWYWQPTGMDISSDNRRAIVLTYGGVYLYERGAGENWMEAMRREPHVISAAGNRQAESITFDESDDAVLITLEQRHAPLYRLELSDGVVQ